MSILENLKSKTAPPQPYAPTAPAIRKKLDALQARLGPLQAQLSELALETELGNADAARKFTAVFAEVAEIKAAASQLSLAHKAAVERDQQQIVQQRASLARAQLNAVRRHREALDTAAAEMDTALKTAAEKLLIVVEKARKAKEACPVGCEWPQGSITEAGQVQKLVAAYLYRLAPGDAMRSSPFPGAACGFDQQGKPDSIPTVGEACKADTIYVMGKLTGKSAD